jgi:O-antigen/teichoic acid export membrane protein
VNIRSKLRNNKTLFVNFSYLSILQIFIIVFPLLTYPYLIRVIGLELYGVVLYGQTLMTYVSLLINFGFNMSSSREVAIHRENPTELSRIVSTTYFCKFLLWLLCAGLYFTVISIVPFFQEYYWVYALSYMLTINELLLPIWFFQGIEKMKYITLVNVSTRLIFVVAIFVVVHHREDYLYVPLLNGIGSLFGGLMALYIVIRKERVPLRLPRLSDIKGGFSASLPLFVSTLSTQLYANVNKLVVGTFLGMSEVTIYDLGEKIVRLIKIPVQMISQTTFPKISRERNIGFLNRLMRILGLTVSFIYVLLFILSPWIVKVFTGMELPMATDVMRILGISVIFSSLNLFMGGNRLVPFGHSKIYMRVMVQNCLSYFVCLALLYFIGGIDVYTISLLSIFVEIVCCAQLLYWNNRLGILRK